MIFCLVDIRLLLNSPKDCSYWLTPAVKVNTVLLTRVFLIIGRVRNYLIFPY